MSQERSPFARRLRKDERGQALIFFAIAVVAVFGIAGFAIDTAQMLQLRREMQASTDAAALAAAQFLPDANAALNAARSYSSIKDGGGVGVDGLNRRPNHPNVTMATGYPLAKCVTKPGYPSCVFPQANVIVVRQTSEMPTFFSRVIGRDSLTITAHSAALMKGGVPETLDVAIIFDTTASMNSNATCGSLGNISRLNCAFAGFRALLNGFWPCQDNVENCSLADAVDAVSLFTFPGFSSDAIAALNYDCSGSPDPALADYHPTNTIYRILGLTNDYKTSNTSALNTNSNLVIAARGAPSPCHHGMEAIGGVGTYYAGAIKAAQEYLVANNRPGAQKVLILLSDGDANSDDISSSIEDDQCQQAVAEAATARTAGTWVYSIAYGADPASSTCSQDSPNSINACNTMRQIASDPSKFYSTDQSGSNECDSAANPQTDLVPIFQHISLSLTTTRLVDE